MTRRIVSTRRAKAGLPPGTPVHVGERRADGVRFSVMTFGADGCDEHTPPDVPACVALRGTAAVTWINIDGVHDVAVVTEICKAFDVHPLVQEDVVNTDQRPKAEDYGSYLFLVIKMLQHASDGAGISTEQVSMIVMDGLVISFQERPGDVFQNVRERIRTGKGNVRKRGADYLAYCLIDAVVDHYFIMLEQIESQIEPLEEEVVTNPAPGSVRTIQGLKRDLLLLRRSLWPLREMVYRLSREGAPAIADDTKVFLRDLYDHVIHLIELVETFQELASGTMDVYLSSISNRMNSVMKVLTIISTIFIPLTFIAGVYGMNFLFMPELEWRYAYPAVLGVMVGIVAFMIRFFRKKGWL